MSKLKARSRIRSRIKWWIVPVVVLPVAAVVLIWKMQVFSVGEIEIQGSNYTDPQMIRSHVEPMVLGISIFNAKPSDIRNSILNGADHPYISDIHVEKILPGKIVVKVTERAPLVCLEGVGVVDTAGDVFIEGECSGSVDRFFTSADEVDLEQIKVAYEIKAALIESGVLVKRVELRAYQGIRVGIAVGASVDGAQVEFSMRSERTIGEQLGLLFGVLPSLEGRPVEGIDVRFDKAVVK